MPMLQQQAEAGENIYSDNELNMIVNALENIEPFIAYKTEEYKKIKKWFMNIGFLTNSY